MSIYPNNRPYVPPGARPGATRGAMRQGATRQGARRPRRPRYTPQISSAYSRMVRSLEK